ncbi:MAG TPA: LptF/LptG family permease [Chitinophagales bacterium]|nr:LptF/LptG family permease [Chitinophagales bacterium]
MILTTLDRYIIRKFLGTFLLAIVLFSFISVAIDLTEKIDELIEKSVPLRETIFGYYLNFLPYIDALLAPLFIFISVIFFTSRMAYKSEIIALLASGVNFYRLLVPYFISAALLAGLLLYANHFGVPNTNKKRLAFEYTYIDNPYKNLDRNIYMQIAKDKYIYMENFHPREGVGYKFSYEIIRNGQLQYKLRAEKIEWRKDGEKWRLKNYYIRIYRESGETLKKGATLDTVFGFKPDDIFHRVSVKEEMTTPVLRQHIAALRMQGVEKIEFYLIELYRRTADAFTVFILMLIGVAVASRKVRGGSGLHLAFGVALSASFIIFTRFSTTFATNGNLSPFLSVWIPNAIYGALAVWLIAKAPK